MSVFVHTLHAVLAGVWLGGVVFTTAVVSSASWFRVVFNVVIPQPVSLGRGWVGCPVLADLALGLGGRR